MRSAITVSLIWSSYRLFWHPPPTFLQSTARLSLFFSSTLHIEFVVISTISTRLSHTPSLDLLEPESAKTCLIA